MNLKNTLCTIFALITFISLSVITILKFDKIDISAVFVLIGRTVPAAVIMGILGHMMGAILDKPKNLADSDYQTDVLSSLKKIDKSMTLADLNEKLTPIADTPSENINIQEPPASGDKNAAS